MSEWKTCKLSEIGVLKRGKSKHRPRYAFHLYGGPYPFVQTGDVKAASKYIRAYSQTYSEDGLKQSMLWRKGTLCITIAANIADVALLGFDACFPDSVLGFQADEKLSNQDFVYYLLIYAKNELLTYADGSVQDNINLGTFEKVKFSVPPLPTQRAIAEVLSSLDDKIDLLTRQNATLEALAQTYFRQWFGSSDSKEPMPISKIAYLKCESINPTARPLEPYYHYSIPAFDNSRTPIIELGQEILSNKYIVQPNSILVSKLNPITPRIWLIGETVQINAVCSTEFQVLMPRENKYQLYLYCLMKSNDVVQDFAQSATGTSGSHQRIRPEQILLTETSIPNEQRIDEFTELSKPMFDKIERNNAQILTLQRLRDTLLPKLISGEVRVKQQGGET